MTTSPSLPPLIPPHQLKTNHRQSFCSSSDDDDSFMMDEHKFWQVHSSTLIISPPLKSPTKNRVPLNLASQVKQILGSTIDQVDEEIEQEWNQRRRTFLSEF